MFCVTCIHLSELGISPPYLPISTWMRETEPQQSVYAILSMSLTQAMRSTRDVSVFRAKIFPSLVQAYFHFTSFLRATVWPRSLLSVGHRCSFINTILWPGSRRSDIRIQSFLACFIKHCVLLCAMSELHYNIWASFVFSSDTMAHIYIRWCHRLFYHVPDFAQ